MTKNTKKMKKYIEITAAVFASACLFGACSDKANTPAASYSYGPEIGLASGNVDLSKDNPDINISDIKSPVGENIDFLSGVTVINESAYADLEVWADGSTIDIFTPGNYTVTYTFKYSDKSFSKDVKVTIFDPNEGKEPEVSIDVENSQANEGNGNTLENNNNYETETTGVQNNSSDNTNPIETTKPNDETNPIVTDKIETTDKTSSSNKQEENSNSQGSSKPETTITPTSTTRPIETTKPISTTAPTSNITKPTSTTKPVATTKPNNTTKPTSTTAKKDNTTREIITTKGNKTTSNKYIGNYTIELLSGKTITVKNSTAKYIVSTRTESSQTTKNGSNYKISKLIIRYNTGAEQILEVVEEKINK